MWYSQTTFDGRNKYEQNTRKFTNDRWNTRGVSIIGRSVAGNLKDRLVERVYANKLSAGKKGKKRRERFRQTITGWGG